MDIMLTCIGCGAEFEGESPKMCCSGEQCGCMGMPIDPVICSKECYEKLPFRRSKKGITDAKPVYIVLDMEASNNDGVYSCHYSKEGAEKSASELNDMRVGGATTRIISQQIED